MVLESIIAVLLIVRHFFSLPVHKVLMHAAHQSFRTNAVFKFTFYFTLVHLSHMVSAELLWTSLRLANLHRNGLDNSAVFNAARSKPVTI